MGCTSSKLDDLPAVALCRDRCNFLDEAIRERYALSQAHIAYIHSLKGVGLSLRAFLDHDFGDLGVSAAPSTNKSDQVEKIENEAKSPQHSHSNSGSHLDFNSDSDEDDSDSHLFHHSEHDSPLHNHEYVHMNYMRNKATPSVVYEQKPMSPETVRIGESSSFYQYPYPSNDVMPYPYYGYPSYGGGYYGSSSAPPPQSSASSSKPPPPPPSPPRTSAWDFLNVFESHDSFYAPNTPSRDSKELREEEGIPDLEDEDFQQEVVKEVHGDQKFVDGNSKAKKVEDVERKIEEGEPSTRNDRPSSSVESEEVEYEVHVVDEKVVEDLGKNEERRTSKGPIDASEVVREVEVQFERASESGNGIAKILEVGRLPYNRKHVTSKMLHVVTPALPVVSSQPSTSRSAESSSTENRGPAYLDIDEDLAMRAKNLSATLQRLYLWEKKLYNEVKLEEKMRVEHDRKRKKLKRLDERGAEADRVDSTRSSVKNLATKIRMAIQVVDKISVTINKIRDEELWPQLLELIKGLTEMYRCMFECHHVQCQAIRDARGFGLTRSGKTLSDNHLEAILQFEHELIKWTSRFSNWISAQKGYVRALNNWLVKCLLYEPEETPDGVAPFSPGRIGAPPVFVICNQWSKALDRLSEKEVIDSMRVFANGVLQLWEQDKAEMQQRMLANRELERKVRFLDREDQKIQKEIQALDKNLILASGDNYSLSVPVYQSDTSKNTLRASLLRIFEAMESFTAESTRIYEELLQRSEEEAVRTRG